MDFLKTGCILNFLFFTLPLSCDGQISEKKVKANGQEEVESLENFQERIINVVDSSYRISERLGMSSKLADLRRTILEGLHIRETISVAFPLIIISAFFFLLVEMIMATLLVLAGGVG